MKIDTRNPAALAMTVIGVLLLAGTLGFELLVKPPNTQAAIHKDVQSELALSKNRDANSVAADRDLSTAQTRLWDMADDQIGPGTLRIVTMLAQKHGVKMSSFRPQKETATGTLQLLPFFVGIDGPFPSVAAFLQDFETNQQTLAVNMVQLASSDQNSHNVTASLEVSAYIDPNRTAEAASKDASLSTAHTKPAVKHSGKDAAHSDRSLPRGSSKA